MALNIFTFNFNYVSFMCLKFQGASNRSHSPIWVGAPAHIYHMTWMSEPPKYQSDFNLEKPWLYHCFMLLLLWLSLCFFFFAEVVLSRSTYDHVNFTHLKTEQIQYYSTHKSRKVEYCASIVSTINVWLEQTNEIHSNESNVYGTKW